MFSFNFSNIFIRIHYVSTLTTSFVLDVQDINFSSILV